MNSDNDNQPLRMTQPEKASNPFTGGAFAPAYIVKPVTFIKYDTSGLQKPKKPAFVQAYNVKPVTRIAYNIAELTAPRQAASAVIAVRAVAAAPEPVIKPLLLNNHTPLDFRGNDVGPLDFTWTQPVVSEIAAPVQAAPAPHPGSRPQPAPRRAPIAAAAANDDMTPPVVTVPRNRRGGLVALGLAAIVALVGGSKMLNLPPVSAEAHNTISASMLKNHASMTKGTADGLKITVAVPEDKHVHAQKAIYHPLETLSPAAEVTDNYVSPDGDTDAPVAYSRINDNFGMRIHPILGGHRMHTGLDLKAAYGTPVHVRSVGCVEISGRQGGYGNFVEIRHNNFINNGDGSCSLVENSDQPTIHTGYGHLSKRVVQEGAMVMPDELIGKVGSTGLSTGPHLHYEVRIDGCRPTRHNRYCAVAPELDETPLQQAGIQNPYIVAKNDRAVRYAVAQIEERAPQPERPSSEPVAYTTYSANASVR